MREQIPTAFDLKIARLYKLLDSCSITGKLAEAWMDAPNKAFGYKAGHGEPRSARQLIEESEEAGIDVVLDLLADCV